MVDRDSNMERVPPRSAAMFQNSPSSLLAHQTKPITNYSPKHPPRLDCSIVDNPSIRATQMYPPPEVIATCTDCATDSSPCASLSLSSECTDQCVVITCTDPEHELSPSNHWQDRRPNFNGAPSGCAKDNCSRFDELLQCCTTYLPQGAFPTNSMDFHGLNFGAMHPCDCENTMNLLSSPSSESLSTISSSFPRTPPDFARDDFTPVPNQPIPQDYTGSSHQYFETDQVFDASPFSPFHSPSLQTPSGMRSTFPSPQTLHCMWANCGASFTSLAALVGHVNVEHLHLSTSAAPQVAPSVTACRWDNCTLYSTPEMIPGPSNPTANHSLDVLASHLLHDHLGLPIESPLSYTALWPLGEPHQGTTPPPTGAKDTPREPDTIKLNLNTTSHPCRWKGCSRTFSSDAELTDHLNVAHIGAGKAQYECHWEGCERNGTRSFSSKQKICRHLQSHTGHRPFQCGICHQHFSEAATLQQHMRRHTQEKPYVCDHPGCGKAFAIAGALTIHKRMHNGHRPFKCSYCQRGFSESSNLTKHLRTHTGDRPYPCTVAGCDKAFARPDQLTRHMFVHNKTKSAATPPPQKKRKIESIQNT